MDTTGRVARPNGVSVENSEVMEGGRMAMADTLIEFAQSRGALCRRAVRQNRFTHGGAPGASARGAPSLLGRLATATLQCPVNDGCTAPTAATNSPQYFSESGDTASHAMTSPGTSTGVETTPTSSNCSYTPEARLWPVIMNPGWTVNARKPRSKYSAWRTGPKRGPRPSSSRAQRPSPPSPADR